jgi:hypothetical protein
MTATMIDHQTHTRIPGVEDWLSERDVFTRDTLAALGDLLSNRSSKPKEESAEEFISHRFNVRWASRLISERRDLSGVSRITVGLATAQWMTQHNPEMGPGNYGNPPRWDHAEIGTDTLHYPADMVMYFPAGSLDAHADLALKLYSPSSGTPFAEVYARPADRDVARAALDKLSALAHDLNPFRGRVLRATSDMGLSFEVITLPDVNRTNVVVSEQIWAELDLNISAVTEHHELLNNLGLGVRRGVMLVGPPGVGKSAATAVIARELLGQFTIMYVDAKTGGHSLLTAVMEQGMSIGGGVVVVLEDVDLYVRDRRNYSGSALGDLLMALDITPSARLLVIATSNDATTLDAAAIRTGRFDSIMEIPYPDRDAAARILSALVTGVPGGDSVDTEAVAGALTEKTSGADIREIVRRCVLQTKGSVSTAALLNVVRGGRWRPSLPGGNGTYL